MAEANTETNQLRTIQPIEDKAAYSKRDAGKITGTSESTIHRAIKARRLKAAFVGRRVVIRGAELLRWLQACEGGVR